ncbi:MAG: hypothetical protein LW855_07675 [Alphaproteobacteria bacterium]|jgi:plasmid stability protein|nr:hypothetical protein [Alphaproteobacteria bacterium]
MADVKIRKLKDIYVEWFKQDAKRKGISLEEELRQRLEQSILDQQLKARRALIEDLKTFKMIPAPGYDSVKAIRGERDRIGKRVDATKKEAARKKTKAKS